MKKRRVLATILAALLATGSVELSVPTAYAAQAELVPEKAELSETSNVMTITDFEELEEAVMQQLLPVGASEEEIIFPDTLNVTVSVLDTQEEETTTATVRTKNVALTGVAWEIDPAESDGEGFDSREDCDGYCYVYMPVLPETDEDGNTLALGEGVEAPAIYVLIGEGENHVNAIAVEGYDNEGFCEGYSWVDGVLTKNTGDGKTQCSHTDCNGYQPATLESYDVDGNGTTADDEKAYKITNAGQLYWFAAYVNKGGDNLNANAYLANDITVNTNLLSSITTDPTTGEITNDGEFRKWVPIGNCTETSCEKETFNGVFDGKSNSIKGIYINEPDSQFRGMFGKSTGTIKNLNISGHFIKGNSITGSVCGRKSGGTIMNCHVDSGKVSGKEYIGGITGNNTNGLIEACSNSCTVMSKEEYAGGITSSNGGIIKSCVNEGEISASKYGGGISGDNNIWTEEDTCRIEKCINKGTITGTYGGGICGQNITKEGERKDGLIVNCYNEGSAGYGICYQNKNKIENCYTRSNCVDGNFEGGIYSKVYYCSESSNTNDVDGITAMTADDFASGKVAYLLNQGQTSTVWYQNIDSGTADGYPVLDSTHGTVYASNPCPSEFSNTQPGEKSHIFKPDSADNTKHICENCGEKVAHSDVVYKADETKQDTIIASCSCGYSYGNIVLKAPDAGESGLVYDGNVKAATVDKNLTLPDGVTISVTEANVTYSKVESGTETALNGQKPTNAGTYKASITIDGKTAYVEYTIAPKSVDLDIAVTGGSTFDGSAKTPAVTVKVKDTTTELTKDTDYTVRYQNNINAGTDTAKAIVTAKTGGNYTWTPAVEKTFSIAKADAMGSLGPMTDNCKEGGTRSQTASVANVGMPSDAGTLTYSVGTPDVEGTATVSSFTVDQTGLVSYTITNGEAGAVITLPVKISSTNYADSIVNVVITLTNKDVPTVSANDITATYTGTALTDAVITGTATFNGQTVAGSWSFTDAGASFQNVADSRNSVSVTFTPEDTTNFAAATATIKVAINKATPTGTPGYTAITTAGKKLSDANLQIGTITPDGGIIAWELGDDTVVEANTSYNWTYTPTDSDNYNTLSGSITPYRVSAPSSSGGGSSSGSTSSSTTVTVPVSSDHASVEVKAEVSKGNATVEVSDKQIENVIADHAGEVTIDVSDLRNVESATIPSHVIEKTNEAENTGLTVALPAGSVTLDETALGSVTENANGKDVAVSVVSVPTTNLPPVVKEIIGMEPTVVAVVDVNVTIGGKKQSSFDGGKVTISVPYTPKKGEDTSKLTVWFIRDDGTIENKGGYYDAEKKCFVFETEHLSQYLLVNTNELVSFTDVPANAYYAAAVNWAAKQNITGGIGGGKFGPDLGCTRAQIVTFLYRCAVANGVDVSVGESTNILSYSDALEVPEYAVAPFQWAVGAGIIQGADGKLMPNDDCTRAQIVTMLYRYEVSVGNDVSVGENTNILSYADFASVPEYAVAPFQWAVGANIIQGADGKLMPADTCTRAQIVTMLYRLLGE